MIELVSELLSPLFYKSRYFYYRAKKPTLSLSISSKLRKSLVLGDNVSIGKNTLVSDTTIGNNVTIQHDCCLINVLIGDFSYVSSGTQLDLTQVGKFCSLGPQILCGCGGHPIDLVSTNPVFFSTSTQSGFTFAEKDYFKDREDIIIGHDVWIGARAFIKDGVKVGNGAVIAAGAVVVKDVPNYAIVGGTPAKIIRYRFPPEIIQELLIIQWWNWPVEKLQDASSYFSSKDIHAFIEWAKNTESPGN
jgi:acetyltransferase-like isoleucine patch superfamily enzyme